LKKLFIYLLFSYFIVPIITFGQTKFDQKKRNQLFWEGEYEQILPDLQLMYNQDRNDIDVNFKLGTSLLFESDSTYKIEKALGHLTYASASNEALAEYHFFYGRCLHFLGEFDKAIQQFEKYIEKKNKSTRELPVNEFITYCNSGKTAVTLGVSDFKKVSSIKFELNSLGKSYSLEKIEKANQFNLNSELQSKIDKKYNHIPLLYYNEDLNMRFFSSYGEKDLGNKDIYMRIGSGENKKNN